MSFCVLASTAPFRARAQFRSIRRLSTNDGDGGITQRFWAWTTQTRPHWKVSKTEAAVVFCVFGVTGSSSVAFVRPCLKNFFGLEGSMKDGPNSYRVISLVAVSPIYACCLLMFGTLAGRHTFFAMMATKIFGRFMPSSFIDKVSQKLGCPTAFRVKPK